MKGIVDRFEEGIAVIQLEGGGELLFPADRIPSSSKEGSVIEITVSLDEKATEERRDLIRKRQERLK